MDEFYQYIKKVSHHNQDVDEPSRLGSFFFSIVENSTLDMKERHLLLLKLLFPEFSDKIYPRDFKINEIHCRRLMLVFFKAKERYGIEEINKNFFVKIANELFGYAHPIVDKHVKHLVELGLVISETNVSQSGRRETILKLSANVFFTYFLVL